MTTRTKLMLMAAALAPLPLYAQQPEAAPAPAAVVAPAQQVQTAAAQRAAVLAPLACIPADAEAALFLQTSDLCPCCKGPLTQAKSIAIAAAKGSGQTAKELYTMLTLGSWTEIKVQLAQGWSYLAKEQLRDTLKEAAEQIPAKDSQMITDALAVAKIHPVYAVISYGSDNEAKKHQEEFITHTKMEAEDIPWVKPVTIGDFTGVVFDSKLRKATASQDEDSDNLLEQKLSDNTYFLTKVVGGNLVCIFCGDPEEIALPATPETSILNSGAFDSLDANLKDNIIASAYISTDTLAQIQEGGVAVTDSLFGDFAAIFDKLADKDEASADALKAAATGFRAISEQGHAASIPAQHPIFFKLWGTPGAYHGEMSFDAYGLEFIPGKPALSNVAADADTIFCVESTSMKLNHRADLDKICTSLQAILAGVHATLPGDTQQAIASKLSPLAAFAPEAKKALCAGATVASGLGGTAGIVVDGKGAAPAFITGSAKVDMPRLSFYSGVVDRSKLSEGWDSLMSTTGEILEKCGQDPSMLMMLPIVPSKVGENATGYSLAVPGILTPDFGLNVTVSDSAFAAGTSSKLNADIVTTASGSEEFAGITFTLHTAPLAKLVRSIADVVIEVAGKPETTRVYLDEEKEEAPAEEEPAEEADTIGCGCGNCDVDEKGECVCAADDKEDEAAEEAPEEEACEDSARPIWYEKHMTYGEENGREYQEEVTYYNPAQKEAQQLDIAAKSLEECAKHVKEIKGEITVKDGKETIHVDVNLVPAK